MASIPVIGRSVGPSMVETPSLARMPESVIPAISDTAQKVATIYAAQQENADKIATETALTPFRIDSLKLKQQVLGNPSANPEETFQAYQTGMKALIQQHLDKPENARLAAPLKLRLEQVHANDAEDVIVGAAKGAEQAQEMQLAAQKKSSAVAAAADFHIDPKTSTVVDGAMAHESRDDFYRLVDSLHKPDLEKQVLKQGFERDVMTQRATVIADNHPTMLDAFVKQHPEITPDEYHELLGRAHQAINRPIQVMDDANALARVKAVDQFTKQVSEGYLNYPQLEAARRGRIIDEVDFERFAKVPFVEPSDPMSVQNAQRLIDDSHSPEELDAARVAIVSNGNIRGKESLALTGAIGLKKTQVNTAIEKAKAEAQAIINRSYELGGMDKNFYNKFAPTSVEGLRKGAEDEWKINVIGVSDPNAIIKAAREATKNHAIDESVLNPKGATPIKAVMPTVVPSAEPTREEKLRRIAELRAKGIMR